MDSIRAEKLRAMNSYKKNQFLYNLILHSLISLSCSLLFSYPYWFPSDLCCTMKHFLSASLPNLSAVFVNPKCLFVVVNVIVIFLVGESKLGASNSSPVGDLYDEYVERSQNLRGQKYSTFQEIRKVEKNSETQDHGYNFINQACLREEESNRPDEKEEKKLEMNLIENSSSTTTRIEGKEVIKEKEKEKEVVKAEEEKEVNVKAEEEKEVNVKAEDDDVEDEEEEAGLPAEELNRRADEFIARVNRQMWIEAI